ncbi:hypothetical protein J5N97_018717 [Dioscorea zingiberensis]|uniref:Uncharacterized protein n=1 Tax=Dioscorea zingiberensis TaxID=325984 RepID=A0A9D5HC65_9LILI|nr:hypothetical protein J5N97_018717 [Dioscorea zingiberensis]
MKCKRHPYEAGPGVCASCLRDRLLDVLAAQIALAETPRRRPEPILLPTSISPHRRSVDSAGPRHQHLFFSTPQVGPSSTASACRSRSFLSSLFSHPRSNEARPDPEKPKRSASISWIYALIPRSRRRKKPKVSSPPPMRRACRDRGMSPAAEEEEERDTASESGYSTEASGMSRRAMPTPTRAHHHQRHRHGGSGFGGFPMCLSPLLRASPAGRRCHAAPASEIGFSGDLRPVLVHPRSGGGGDSFGPNRSRKLADFGRFR